MDIRKIQKLIELVRESGIAEIEIHEGEESLRISRHSPVTYQAVPAVPTLEALPATRTSAAPAEVPVKAEPDGHIIASPMVGTLYLGASPSSPAFIKVGQKVKRGDIVCIIEAMKVMNQIEADADGIVSSILVENAQPVQYDQPIFVLQHG
jgi:acetyl-CoA carboxylase biotin carboxyl carrier protein